MKLEKQKLIKKKGKNELTQLNRQTCDMSHETKTTYCKANWNKIMKVNSQSNTMLIYKTGKTKVN